MLDRATQALAAIAISGAALLLTGCPDRAETQIGNPPSPKQIAQTIIEDDTLRAAFAAELKDDPAFRQSLTQDPDFRDALAQDLSEDLTFRAGVADTLADRIAIADIAAVIADDAAFQGAVADNLITQYLDEIRGPQGPAGSDDALLDDTLFTSSESLSNGTIPGRQLLYTRTNPNAPLRVTYFDTLAVNNGSDAECGCRWELIFDGFSYFPEPLSQRVTAPPQSNRQNTVALDGLCAAHLAGPFEDPVRIEVSVSSEPGCSCGTGAVGFEGFIRATEIAPIGE